MEHSHHMGMDHGGMDHGDMPMCSMQMTFHWDPQNLCIIFKGWRVTSIISLLLSLIAVAALTAGYEYVRAASAAYEESCRRRSEAKSPILTRQQVERIGGEKTIKALFYAVQVFYSFFIMLLFMTYNGWIMLAVAVGAFGGYLVWGSGSATKSVACH